MKMLNANEVNQVSGGDAQSDREFMEWLWRLDAEARRNNYYAPIRDL